MDKIVVKNKKGKTIITYFYSVMSVYELQLYFNKPGWTVERVKVLDTESEGE